VRRWIGTGKTPILAFVPGALIIMSAVSALAQVAPVPEAVLITARPPDPVGNAAFSTELVGSDQLQVTPDLDAALRQVPALALFRSDSSLSAVPARIGVSLRSLIGGSGVGRVLVTLDGVPQNDPFGQWVVPASLPVEGIESVELVRGAGAGPYGAGALTGAIEISERTHPVHNASASAQIFSSSPCKRRRQSNSCESARKRIPAPIHPITL
jgi:outer membrane cobalamin receptor